MSARPRARGPLRRSVPRPHAAVLIIATICGSLAGCTAISPTEPTSSPETSASASASAEPDPTAAEPVLEPQGTADDNLPYFDLVNTRFLQADSMPGGRAIIDNLVAAGFDRAAMQVTPDATAIGRDVDAVGFSVQIGERCLIGQASGSGYVGIVGDVVPGAGCLIGITRAIDW